MRSAVAVLAALAVAGIALLAVLGLTRDSSLVYTLGVQPQLPAIASGPGNVTCQSPLLLPRGARFDRIVFYAAAEGAPANDLSVSIRENDDDRELRQVAAAPAAPRGATPPAARRADIAPLTVDRPLQVCFTNRGERRIDIWGSTDFASGPTTAKVDGQPAAADVAVFFERSDESDILALLPEMAERASLFRARWLSPFAYAVVALLVLVAVPALLVRALRSADYG
jgi:hypothetical protein